jgi:hypothetical protein
MVYRLELAIGGNLRRYTEAVKKHVTKSFRIAGRKTAAKAKREGRAKIRRAKLGRDIANALRVDRFKDGPFSDIVYIYHKSKKLFDVHQYGAVLVPKRGKFLAVPTEHAPIRVGRKRNPRYFRPREVPDNVRLQLINIRGQLYLGTRQKGGISRGRGRKGILKQRGSAWQTILMYKLVRRVKIRKKFSFAGLAQRWQDFHEKTAIEELNKPLQ